MTDRHSVFCPCPLCGYGVSVPRRKAREHRPLQLACPECGIEFRVRLLPKAIQPRGMIAELPKKQGRS